MIVEKTPDELCELVENLLQKDPADRPPTALVVSNRLKALQAGLLSRATMAVDDIATQVTDPDSNGANVESTLSSIAGLSPSTPLSVPPEQGKPANSAPGKQDVSGKQHASGTLRPGQQANDKDGDKTRSDASSSPSSTRSDGLRAMKVTEVSALPDQQSSGTVSTQTHFEVVKHNDSSHGAFRFGDHSHGSATAVSRTINIILTLAVLAVLGWAVFSVMSPPSADNLYDKATEQRDIDAAIAFVARYPDDPRIPEVRQWVSQRQLRSILNRITAQQKIGIKPLTAAQESFLAAMEARATDPIEARQEIQQWLNVFQDSQASSGDEPRSGLATMIQAARDELKRPIPSDTSSQDPRVHQLLAEIQSSIDAGDGQATVQKLNAIQATFQDASWAKPVIDRAENWLDQNAQTIQSD
jgi:serine/threonine-protein kinase